MKRTAFVLALLLPSVRAATIAADSARGAQLFETLSCVQCHSINGKGGAVGPDLGRRIDRSFTPATLAATMWNHSTTMKAEFARRRFAWPELTSQDLTDMLVYLRNLPSTRGVAARTEISTGAGGQALFQSKGCSGCHTGKLSLTPLLKNKTLIDIAAAMWNHEPRMAQTPAQLDPVEMREIVSYLWAGEFFEDSGKSATGERVFAAKHCTTCHNDASSGAPALPATGRSFTGATMVSALWRHGPRMMDQMNRKHIAWPRFDGSQMADLIAYLNSTGRSKP